MTLTVTTLKTAVQALRAAPKIRPIIGDDGKEYFVAWAGGYQVRYMHGEHAAIGASQSFAGRDWRRIKREMNRARRESYAEYDKGEGQS